MGFPLLNSQGGTVVTPAYDQNFGAGSAFTASNTTGGYTAAPTDVLTLQLQATPSQVARLKKLRVTLVTTTNTTSTAAVNVNLIRRSANNTATASNTTAVNAVAFDPQNPAKVTPQLQVWSYASSTGAPGLTSGALGTFLGIIDSQVLTAPTVTSAASTVVFDFSRNLDQAPTLRTAAEQLAVNLGTPASNGTTAGAIPAGCDLVIAPEWEESISGGD
jgi:hypothetical protein